MDWRQMAACLNEDPELFFPDGSTGAAFEQMQRAKAVCRNCVVIKQCLQWALDHNQEAGIWGGLSEEERRNIRRLHRPQSRGGAVSEQVTSVDGRRARQART